MGQSPESVVQSFVTDLNKKDFEAASKLVKGGSIPPYMKDMFAETKPFPTLSISGLTAAVIGDRALATYHLKATGPVGPQELDECLVLVRSGDGWLIDVPVKTGGLGEMAYFMSNPPIFVQAHEAAQVAKCMSNVKQVLLALIMLEADNDDVLRVTAANWEKSIARYLKDPNVLTCPEDLKGVSSYSLNANLAGKSATDIEEPSRTVLVYEGKNGRLNFRHGGKATVGFADGHVQRVSPDEAKSLRWK